MLSNSFLRAVAATFLAVILFEICAPFLIFIPEEASVVDVIVALVEAIPFGPFIIRGVIGFMTAVASMTNSFMAALGMPIESFGVAIPLEYTTTHFFVFEFLKATMVAIIASFLDSLVSLLAGDQTHGYFNKYANTLFLITTVFLSTLLVNRIFDFFQAQLILLAPLAQNIILVIAILIVLGGGFWAMSVFLGSFAIAMTAFFLKTVLLNMFRAVIAYYVSFCVLIISGFPHITMQNPLLILALFGIWWLVMMLEGLLSSKIAKLLL